MTGYTTNDTITAPATAPGHGALGILRLSGPRAVELTRSIWPDCPATLEHRRANLAQLQVPVAGEDTVIKEQAVVTHWAAPNSYTGEDLVELSVHGSPVLVRCLLNALTASGARLAEAGEFTYRAFLNDKLDLVQAEAVQELINAGSTRALVLAQSALAGNQSAVVRKWVDELTRLLAGIEVVHDYAADGLDASLDEAELLDTEVLKTQLVEAARQIGASLADSRRTAALREGTTVAILGPPNVGKSTLFNALLGHERALTAAEAGTTRDYLTESVAVAGLNMTLVDTAGYRDTADAVEAAGVQLSSDWGKAADLLLWVTSADGDFAPVPDDLRDTAVNVITRCDLLPRWPGMPPEEPDCTPGTTYYVSGLTGKGIDALWAGLKACAATQEQPSLAAFSDRQAGRIEAAGEVLETAVQSLELGMPLDAVAQDLYRAVEELRGVYEHSDRQAVIDEVFSSFCVGK